MNKYLEWQGYFRKAVIVLKNINKNIEKHDRSRYCKRTKADALKYSLKDNPNNVELSASQKNEISLYFQPYTKINMIFHEFYYKSTGIFDVRYLPDDLYYNSIDTCYNNWEEGHFLDNKSYYRFIFHDVKQPKLIASRSNGIWTDSTDSILPFKTVLDTIKNYDGCFIKEATESMGGHGVSFVPPQEYDTIPSILNEIDCDIVIQQPIKQCKILNDINSTSVNTIRILSLLRDNKVTIYSSILRMGMNGSKVDNASSGGITCGIKDDGTLKAVAYSANGRRYDTHPDSLIHFDSVVVPSFREAKELVKRIHPRLSHFRLISWDIAIDEDNEPVLIEANLYFGELDFHQLNNGPLFGNDTEIILKEVFSK